MEKIMIAVADGTDMQAHVARPSETAKKGIIIVQEAFGVTDYIRRMAERFAGQDFLAVAPEFFHRSAGAGEEFPYTDYEKVVPHMQALTTEGQEADLTAAYNWLMSEGVPAEKIVVLGFCMGGRASFLANTILPLSCAVSFYGGGIAENLLDRTGALHGPQLLLWGGKDAHITPDKTRAVADALVAAHKPFVEATFAEAGHAFARDVGDHYHEPSAREAWALADAFIAEAVGENPR